MKETSDFFSDRLLLLVIKFYIINFNMMLMIMIYAVLIHWLNLFQYVLDCQLLVFLLVASSHMTTCQI